MTKNVIMQTRSSFRIVREIGQRQIAAITQKFAHSARHVTMIDSQSTATMRRVQTYRAK